MRSQALLFIKRMYEKEQLREYVEKFALNYLQLLVHPNPPSVLFGADKDTGSVPIHQGLLSTTVLQALSCTPETAGCKPSPAPPPHWGTWRSNSQTSTPRSETKELRSPEGRLTQPEGSGGMSRRKGHWAESRRAGELAMRLQGGRAGLPPVPSAKAWPPELQTGGPGP